MFSSSRLIRQIILFAIAVLLIAAAGLTLALRLKGRQWLQRQMSLALNSPVTIGAAHIYFPNRIVLRDVVIPSLGQAAKIEALWGFPFLFGKKIFLSRVVIQGADLVLMHETSAVSEESSHKKAKKGQKDFDRAFPEKRDMASTDFSSKEEEIPPKKTAWFQESSHAAGIVAYDVFFEKTRVHWHTPWGLFITQDVSGRLQGLSLPEWERSVSFTVTGRLTRLGGVVHGVWPFAMTGRVDIKRMISQGRLTLLNSEKGFRLEWLSPQTGRLMVHGEGRLKPLLDQIRRIDESQDKIISTTGFENEWLAFILWAREVLVQTKTDVTLSMDFEVPWGDWEIEKIQFSGSLDSDTTLSAPDVLQHFSVQFQEWGQRLFQGADRTISDQ